MNVIFQMEIARQYKAPSSSSARPLAAAATTSGEFFHTFLVYVSVSRSSFFHALPSTNTLLLIQTDEAVKKREEREELMSSVQKAINALTDHEGGR